MKNYFPILKEWLPLLNTIGIIAILLHYIKKLRGIHQETTKLQDEHIDFLKSQTPAFIYEQMQAIKTLAEEKVSYLEKEKAEIEKRLIKAEQRFQEELRKADLDPKNSSNISQAKENLETSSRIEAITRVAHEILGPLQSMAIMIDELSSVTNTADDRISQSQIIGRLKREIRQIALRIRSAQLASQPIPLDIHGLNRFRLGDLVMSIYDIVSNEAKLKGTPIEIDMDQDVSDTTIKSDFEKFQIILFNILTNAIKYSFKGRAIKLKVYRDDADVIFEVINIGIGIAPEEEELIFLKGYRGALSSERARTGAGMGLFLANNIASSFGGNVHFESSRIMDSEFTVKFTVRIPIRNS